MKNFVLKKVTSNYLYDELGKIGFDLSYRNIIKDKFNYINIKIFSLSVAQANILKQSALSVGAECATHHDVVTGKIEVSDVILTGSYSQLKKIALKLEIQPFGLKQLSKEILIFLDKQERKTKVAGILNVTPDSFSDGGKYIEPSFAINHLIGMIEDGADMIDIGAESTKPYSLPVDSIEQIKRLKPILDFITSEKFTIPFSVDTRSSKVAEFALDNGIQFINDVSGFDYDNEMPKIVSKYNAGVIIQHSLGTPETMQNSPVYSNLIDDIYFKLKEKLDYAESLGIKNIILDVGIGFGKTKENNVELLNRIEEFYSLDKPIMCGISRKSFLGVSEEDCSIKDALTLAYSYPLMLKNVDYLRVHNVKLHKLLLKNM